MGLLRVVIRLMTISRPPRYSQAREIERPIPREMRFPVVGANETPAPQTILKGRCWVIDGDTIVIDNVHVRLAGIDAPELDHPWGQQSKWAMVKLCKGQTITAHIRPELSYDRVVAECFLPDGRDLAAELVKAGLALDWPKFSGGKYLSLEPADARRKLWRASLRQGGLLMAEGRSEPNFARGSDVPVRRGQAGAVPPVLAGNRYRPMRFHWHWAAALGTLVLLVGCNLVMGDRTAPMPSTPTLDTFAVLARALNIRQGPTSTSGVIAQITMGTLVEPTRVSGAWYQIELPDGRTGWVHRDYLSPVGH
jgi:micrococcal nuclease